MHSSGCWRNLSVKAMKTCNLAEMESIFFCRFLFFYRVSLIWNPCAGKPLETWCRSLAHITCYFFCLKKLVFFLDQCCIVFVLHGDKKVDEWSSQELLCQIWAFFRSAAHYIGEKLDAFHGEIFDSWWCVSKATNAGYARNPSLIHILPTRLCLTWTLSF